MLVQVTVNSGGVVFFALFNQPENDESSPKEAAAVIKFSSSRMATQSERLGYEFARWLGVQTPQVVPSYCKYFFSSLCELKIYTHAVVTIFRLGSSIMQARSGCK